MFYFLKATSKIKFCTAYPFIFHCHPLFFCQGMPYRPSISPDIRHTHCAIGFCPVLGRGANGTSPGSMVTPSGRGAKGTASGSMVTPGPLVSGVARCPPRGGTSSASTTGASAGWGSWRGVGGWGSRRSRRGRRGGVFWY